MADTVSPVVDPYPTTYVAAQLPPTAPPPASRRKVNFLLALFVYWLVPRRFGPYLAAGSTVRAYLAAILSVILVASSILVPRVLTEWHVATARGTHWSSEYTVREDVAQIILDYACETSGTTWNAVALIAALSAPLTAELILLILATILMPWAAGGDRAWSVWKRSVRNVHWSLTILLPVAVAIAVLRCVEVDWDRWGLWPDAVVIPFGIVVFLTPVVLLLRMWVVGAHRYVGPADGPAFAPREPLCDQCGYAIVHLPLETRCPECGLAVRESLPGGRREATPWDERRWRPSGLLWLLRLQWQILRRPAFFERLPVHSGIESARHFWWMTVALMILVSLAVIRLTMLVVGSFPTYLGDMLVMTLGPLSGVAGVLLLQMLSILPLCIWAQRRYGILDYRVSATACCMATPLIWPVWAVVQSCMVLLLLYEQRLLRMSAFQVLGCAITPCDAFNVFFALLVMLALWLWLRRVTAALRAVRYANV